MDIKVKLARRAGRVRRYHTAHMVQGEDVAQHTFNCLNLVMILTKGQPSMALLQHVLLHDQGEWLTGDIPSPAKRLMNAEAKATIDIMEDEAINFIHHCGIPELSAEDQRLFKLVDNWDGLIKCVEEAIMGSLDAQEIGNKYVQYLMQMGDLPKLVQDTIDEFQELTA